MNPTLAKFSYPDTLVHEYEHWAVLLRPAQVTLGSVMLVSKSDAVAFGALSAGEYAELGVVAADIERTLKAVFAYDKINYVMLMMNDPNPHFHVLPRYAGVREFGGVEFADASWPTAPDLGVRLDLDAASWEALRQVLIENWTPLAG